MDISTLTPALSAVKDNPSTNTIQGAVSMKMLDTSIDTNQEIGTQMIRMMEQSVNPAVGGNIDVYA